jgi:hypothetical protein
VNYYDNHTPEGVERQPMSGYLWIIGIFRALDISRVYLPFGGGVVEGALLGGSIECPEPGAP